MLTYENSQRIVPEGLTDQRNEFFVTDVCVGFVIGEEVEEAVFVQFLFGPVSWDEQSTKRISMISYLSGL